MRTELEVNESVVPRPGVPDDLQDHYWWLDGSADVGLLGTTAQLGLVPDEQVLDARDALVVSARKLGATAPYEILVRDFATGAVIRSIKTSMSDPDATVIGRHLIWTGLEFDPAPADQRLDGGVWSVDIDADSPPVQIVAPGKVVPLMSGRRLLVSPTRRTVGAVMASYGNPNWVDLIDAATLTRTHRLRGFWPDAITDDTFLQWDQAPTDGIGPGAGLTAYDLNGGVRWRYPAADRVDNFTPYHIFALGNRFFVEYTLQPGDGSADLLLASFDPMTGSRRTLLRQAVSSWDDVLVTQVRMSTAMHLSLSTGYEAFDGAGPRAIALLNVTSTTLTANAYEIDPPWLCFPEWCFRY